MSQFWDQRFSNETYVYGETPNEFFKQELSKLKPGSILFPCEGEGRNAVYAATHGWKVSAFDGSEAAKRKALALAEKHQVAIEYEINPVEHYVVKEGEYDAIVLIFAHFSPEIRLAFHTDIIKGLKKGGVLILEGFRREQLGLSSGGPQQLDMLFDEQMLSKDFEMLDIVHLENSERILDEGAFHQGNAFLIQLVGLKV